MDLVYEDIVIGSDTRALLFAFVNRYPILYTSPRRPPRFDLLDLDIELGFLKIENTPSIYQSFGYEIEFGSPKTDLWEKLMFLLSFEGLNPMSNLCDTIRYDGNILVCSSEYSRLCSVEFERCHYFGDDNINKLLTTKAVKNPTYLCYDYIAFNRGGKHEIDYITTDDDFASKIWFYSSDRICGNTGVKDACVLSKLTAKELQDFEYSETMVAFKLDRILRDNGMLGVFKELSKTGKPLYRKFKISPIERKRYLLDEPEWNETENVIRCHQTLEELIEEARDSNLQNYKYLNEY